MKRIIECVPNFSEGRDLKKIEKILTPFRATEGVKLLDYQKDQDHNRAVVKYQLGGKARPFSSMPRVSK